jgi:hypothetical protein
VNNEARALGKILLEFGVLALRSVWHKYREWHPIRTKVFALQVRISGK